MCSDNSYSRELFVLSKSCARLLTPYKTSPPSLKELLSGWLLLDWLLS